MRIKSDEFMKAVNYLRRVEFADPSEIELELTDGTIIKDTSEECEEWKFMGMGGKHFVLDVLLTKVVK